MSGRVLLCRCLVYRTIQQLFITESTPISCPKCYELNPYKAESIPLSPHRVCSTGCGRMRWACPRTCWDDFNLDEGHKERKQKNADFNPIASRQYLPGLAIIVRLLRCLARSCATCRRIGDDVSNHRVTPFCQQE